MARGMNDRRSIRFAPRTLCCRSPFGTLTRHYSIASIVALAGPSFKSRVAGGGCLQSAALATMIPEVYDRHLPLYQDASCPAKAEQEQPQQR